MNYDLCIICQNSNQPSELRCPACDLRNPNAPEVYQTFLDDWKRFRNAGISISISLPVTDATVENLLAKEAKWHRNCRREFREDKFNRQNKTHENVDNAASGSGSTTTTRRGASSSFSTRFPKICLFCQKPEEGKNVLHSFQKVELTEELRTKAIALNDSNVLTQLSVGDVVSNELKYHAHCYTLFNRRFETSCRKPTNPSDKVAESTIFEEVMGMVEEDLTAGKRYFTLKSLYEEMSRRSEMFQVPVMNRTRLKTAILERFHPILKEEQGFRNEVLLVCSATMKDVVQTSLVSTTPSEDYRILSKAALICRRDMAKLKSFDFMKEGFHADCQKNSVSNSLKYLVGLIMYGPSYKTSFENEQDTLTIAQLIYFNAHTRAKHETPLPIYLGLLLHSKFRNAFVVEELNRVGLSIGYNRVRYIERKLSHSIVQHFNNQNLVCPTEMRNGLFTVGAVDNIDHNPSARTAKDSFHGTAISLFQTRRHEDDGTKRDFVIQSCAPDKLQLPSEFTELPQIEQGGLKNRPPILETETYGEVDSLLLSSEVSKEEEWARSVSSQIQEYSEKDYSEYTGRATWSAYHGGNKAEAVPCISGLFPLFKESSIDPNMILHAMQLIKKSVNNLNPGQVPVITGDQPIYAIMKKLQWTTQESVKDMVVMLGGFHTEKHCMSAIGDLLQGSGWVEAVVKASVASSGTACGLLNAAHVTKARYAHQVTYVALRMLLQEAHQESSPELPIDDWIQKSSKKPTFCYWILVLKYESILLTFVRAHRERKYDLYVESLQKLGELFFAFDHYYYARWVPIHVEDLKRLPVSILEEFRDGKFVVNRSKHRYSSIAIDQSHEQLNKILKGSGGIIGLTEDPSSLLNWSVYVPEVSKLLQDFRKASNTEEEEDGDCDFFHHDEQVKRQGDFLSDVNCMVDLIRVQGNPFLEFGNDLVSLEGQISEDKDTVFLIEKAGKDQYEKYVNDVLIDRTLPFHNRITKNEFRLFKAPKRPRKLTTKVDMHRANASVLGQMYIALHSRQGDIDEFFSHESLSFPPSIADNVEKMYHSRKSDVLHCLQQEVDDMESSDESPALPVPLFYDAVIWDGGALIHSTIPQSGVKTFENYFDTCFLKRVLVELRNTPRVDIVWDSYFELSIKGETRTDRGSGTRVKVAPNVTLPKKWSVFLKNSANKLELFNYLSEATISSQEIQNCDVYITSGDTVRHVGPGKEMTGKIDHEEADTKVVLHVLHALTNGAKTVLVRTVDSDVVIILVHHFHRFLAIAEECEVNVSFGSGKDRRLINIERISNALGRDRCLALPLWFALSGCDSTSSMRGRSKRMTFNAWKKSPVEITQTMAHIMEHPFTPIELQSAEFNALEVFFVKVYGGDEESINEMRKHIFCHRNQNPEMIPPTQDALLQHCRRAAYQASIWASAHIAGIKTPDACQHGWKISNNRLLPVWMTIPQVSAACQEMVKCGCRQNCRGRCSCRAKSLNCTNLCKCACVNSLLQE